MKSLSKYLKGASISGATVGEVHSLNIGDLVALEGNVPHNLTALKDRIIRLRLNSADTVKRVEDVAKNR